MPDFEDFQHNPADSVAMWLIVPDWNRNIVFNAALSLVIWNIFDISWDSVSIFYISNMVAGNANPDIFLNFLFFFTK